MKCTQLLILLFLFFNAFLSAQKIIPFDTTRWNINAQSYILENFQGKNALYLQGGRAELKEEIFTNGTLEFDVFLTKRQGFPGILFRIIDAGNAESFYIRPHLPGKPDANQAVPIINGLSAWQMYFGPAYSFPYDYNYNDWTHVKLVIVGQQAQVYLDHSQFPQFSWNLTHATQPGKIAIGGGGAPMHYADFKMDKNKGDIIDFNPIKNNPLLGIIPKWSVSDKFEESKLDNLNNLAQLIMNRSWDHQLETEEGVAINLSRAANLRSGNPGNTVFAKINITSDEDQVKLFEFGYSDRATVILNGNPIYKGNNGYRTRDYRYLGTIGLFDSVYLPLKKGDNELLMAVSENFGGWLVTGRIADKAGIEIE